MHSWTYALWYVGGFEFQKLIFFGFLSYFGFFKSQKVTFMEFLSYCGFLKSQKVTFWDFGSPGPAVSGSKYRKYVILAVSGKNCSQTVVINIAADRASLHGNNKQQQNKTKSCVYIHIYIYIYLSASDTILSTFP